LREQHVLIDLVRLFDKQPGKGLYQGICW